MTISDAYHSLCHTLQTIYDEREAQSISRLIFEDAFNIRQISTKTSFSENDSVQLEIIKKRLLTHEPMQYIIGFTYFYDIKLKTDQRALIPRPETEELVLWIVENTKRLSSPSILDIGTGSGCIPILLKKLLPNANIHAVDVSEDALNLAKENAIANDMNVDFHHIDILKQQNWDFINNLDVIVSNPPYIPESERNLMAKNVLDFEPDLALFVENKTPLIFYDVISEFALKKLKKGGQLYFETNEYNAQELITLLQAKGFKQAEIQQDINGKDRMVKAIL